jgi:Uri superfamily endonuclease
MPSDDSGVYILVIELKMTLDIKVGHLGVRTFLPGKYLYVGRAKRYLNGRLKRHLRHDKKIFWHIDYLLQHACLEDIWIKPGFFDECYTAAMILSAWPKAVSLVSGFGSSDCHCLSHLFYLAGQEKVLPRLLKNLEFEKVTKHGYRS